MSVTEARFIELGDLIENLDGVKCTVVDIDITDDPESYIGYGMRFKLSDGSTIDVQSEYDKVEVWS